MDGERRLLKLAARSVLRFAGDHTRDTPLGRTTGGCAALFRTSHVEVSWRIGVTSAREAERQLRIMQAFRHFQMVFAA